MKTAIKIELILFIAVLWGFSTYGATVKVGTVILMKGRIKVESQDTFKLFDKPNTPLQIKEADQIHTGIGARVKIFLREKREVIHLYAESVLTINTVTDRQSRFSLQTGKARFAVEPTISKLTGVRRKFQVRTANTFIGVRGTDFIVQTTGISTYLLTVEGVVVMSNLAKPDIEVEVRKNRASKTKGERPPTTAIEVSAESIKKILVEDDAEAWEAINFPEPSASRESKTRAEEPGNIEIMETVDQTRDQIEAATETVQKSDRLKPVKFRIVVE